MGILTEKQMHSYLEKYYREHYGERDTDEWAVNPAVNVWKFERDGKTIILKCHIVSGIVTEKVIDNN